MTFSLPKAMRDKEMAKEIVKYTKQCVLESYKNGLAQAKTAKTFAARKPYPSKRRRA